MSKLLNEEIGSMISLMQRMGSNQNYFDAMKNKKECINEVMTNRTTRRQVTRDELIDMLDKGAIKGGQYVTLTYVCGKKMVKQKVWGGKTNWRQDDMTQALNKHADKADKDWHKQLSDFNSDGTKLKKNPVCNIVATERFTLHWTTNQSYRRATQEYSEKLSNLRMKYGVGLDSNGMLGDNHNQRQKVGYGENEMNQTGNLSKSFNVAGTRPKLTLYLIDENGDIADEIPEEVYRAMVTKNSSVEKAVRDALTPEQIAQYKAEKAELTKAYQARTFNYDGILSIVATVNGEKIYYINDKVKSTLVDINSQAFMEIAKEQLGASFDEIQGFAN